MKRKAPSRERKAPTRVERADVWRDGELAGHLERTVRGSRFRHTDDFLARHEGGRGIAVNLPLSRTPAETTGVNLHPFFAGLLPEGLRLRVLLDTVKTSADDLFSLLLAAGGDTAGDVYVVPAGEQPSVAADAVRDDAASFRELLQRSLERMGTSAEPVLAGVQEKISAATIAFPVRTGSRRKRAILKLEPANLPLLVENEAFFMKMAADLGLETAPVSVVRDQEGARGLLVERFDRVWSREERRVRRVHTEDACQFLDRYPTDKYVVTCADIAERLSVCSAPVPARDRFLRLVAFSYLICNGDLHAKNVSILATDAGFVLSPAYDLLTTLPYGDRRMALALDGRDDNLKRKSFVAFGERFGVRAKATSAMLDELCDRSDRWITHLEEIGFGARQTADLRRTIAKRRNDLGAS